MDQHRLSLKFDPEQQQPSTDKDGKPTKPRRYCGNRLTKCQYILMWIVVSQLVLAAILLPLGYFVIVPAIIKRTFATTPLEAGNKSPAIETLALKQFTNQGLDLKVAGVLLNSKLPSPILFGGVEPAVFRVSDEGGKSVVEVAYSNPVNINGKSDLRFDQDTLTINFPDPETTKTLVSTVLTVTQNGTVGMKMEKTFKITGTASINLMGIIFKNIDLERSQVVDLVQVAKIVDGMLGNSTTSGIPGMNSTTLGTPTLPPRLHKRQESGAPPSMAITLTGLAVRINSRVISTTATGSFSGAQPINLSLGSLSATTTLSTIPVAQVSLSNLTLSSTFGINLDINPLQSADPAVLQDVVKRLVDGRVQGVTAGVKNVTIRDSRGQNVDWLNKVLEGVNFERDLGTLQNGLMTISGFGTGASASSSFSDILKINNLSVLTGRNNTLTITPDVTIKSPFPAKISIEPITGRLTTADNTQLLSFNLPAIEVNGQSQNLQLGVSVAFEGTDAAQLAVAGLAKNVVGGGAGSIRVGGLNIGESSQPGQVASVNSLASLISVTVPLDPSLLLSASSSPATSTSATATKPIISSFALRSASLSITETGFDVGLSAQLDQTLPIRLSIPFANLKLGVDDKDLAGVRVDGVVIGQGSQDLNIGVKGTLTNDTETGTKLTSILNELYATSSQGSTPSRLVLQGIQFGASETDSINLFNKLNLPIPIDLLKSATTPSGMNLPSIFPSPNINIQSLNPSLKSASITTQPDGLGVAAAASLTIPAPISVSMPFIGIDVSTENARIATLAVQGLRFNPGQNELTLDVQTRFNKEDAAVASVGSLASQVLSGSDAKVVVSGVRFGTSEQTANGVFSALRVNLPVPSVNTQGNGSSLALQTLFPNVTLDAATLAPELTALSLNSLQNGVSIAPSVQVNNPLPVSISVPFASVSLLLDDTQFVTASLKGLNLTNGQNSMQLVVDTAFGTDANVQDRVSQLVSGIMNKGQLPGVKVTGVSFGVSEEQAVPTLKGIVAGVPLGDLLSGGPFTQSASDITKLFPAIQNISIASFSPALRSADISSTPDGMTFGIAVGVNNILPVSVNLGHISTDVSLAQSKLTTIAVSNVALSQGQTDVSPSIDLKLGRDPALVSEIGKLFNAIKTGGQASVNLGGFTFGSNPSTPVTAFSKVTIPFEIPLGSITQAGSTGLPIAIPTNGDFAVQSVDGLQFTTTQEGVALGAQAGIVNPFPVSVKFGFLSVGMSTEAGEKIAQFTLSDTKLTKGSGPFNLALDAALGQGQGVAQSVATLFKNFLAKQASSVRVSNILFGDSKEKAFDFLGQLDAVLPLPAGQTAATNITPKFDLSGLSPKILGLDVSTTADGFAATAQASLGQVRVPIKVDLGFAAADLALENTKLATFSTGKINVGDGNVVNVPVNLQMLPMDNNLPAVIGRLANPILASGGQVNQGFTVGANKILFGASKDKPFDILSQIDFSMPVPPEMIASTIKGIMSSNAPGSLPLPKLNDANVATSATGFQASAKASIPPQPLSALLGFASAQVSLDDTLVSTVGIGKTQLDRSGSASTSIDLKLEQGQATQDKVAAVLNPVIASILSNSNATGGNTNVKVSGITFGGEGGQPNPLLSQVVMSLPVSQLTSLIPATPQSTAPTSLPMGASVALAMVPTGVQGNVALQTANMPLTVDIGDLAATIDMGGNRFCDVGVKNIRLAPGQDGNIALDLKLAVKPDIYPKLVSDFLAAKNNILTVSSITLGQPATPLTLLSGLKAPVTIAGQGLLTPNLNLIPPSATFAFNIPLPVKFDVGTLALDGLLGTSKATTISTNYITLSEGGNSVKADFKLSLLGGLTGLPQLLAGGQIAGTNVKLVGKQGDITWISQSFTGQKVPLDLAALLGGGKKNKKRDTVDTLKVNDPDLENLLSSYKWTKETLDAIAASKNVRDLFGFADVVHEQLSPSA
ncbi:hypothetical protein SpCBS45565_g00406 [Spizellomyces sp. 'palustris']|nr:hypothetical protein SpCBS45565_g00406 [Spizellomyces sp. 'palustris']